MRTTILLIAIMNIAIAFTLPALGKGQYSSTVLRIIRTYERLGEGDPPTYSAEESELFRTIERKSAMTMHSLTLVFGGQGIVLLILAWIHERRELRNNDQSHQ